MSRDWVFEEEEEGDDWRLKAIKVKNKGQKQKRSKGGSISRIGPKRSLNTKVTSLIHTAQWLNVILH